MPIVKANEILKERYEILKLPSMYRLVVGNLPAKDQWTMLLHGIAGGGKSTYALKSKDGKTRTNYRGMATIGHLVDINQVVETGGIVWNDKNRLLGKETNKAKGFNIFRQTLSVL